MLLCPRDPETDSEIEETFHLAVNKGNREDVH